MEYNVIFLNLVIVIHMYIIKLGQKSEYNRRLLLQPMSAHLFFNCFGLEVNKKSKYFKNFVLTNKSNQGHFIEKIIIAKYTLNIEMS